MKLSRARRAYAWLSAAAAVTAIVSALLLLDRDPRSSPAAGTANPSLNGANTGSNAATDQAAEVDGDPASHRPAGPTAPENQPAADTKPNNEQRYAFAHLKVLLADDFAGVTSPSHPQWSVAPGFDVAQVATGFTYPVNLAFAGRASSSDTTDADKPWLCVSALHGRIKYLTRSGQTKVYAPNLLNFEPIAQVKTDETGLSGLLVLPNGNLLVTMTYEDDKSGLLQNRVVLLISKDEGRTLDHTEVLLDTDEFTAPSNQIQQVVLGPDEKLYVSVGDAENARLSLDLNKYGGKILRLNLDGSAPADNPFYEPGNPDSVQSRVFAYGVRNIFDFDFHPKSGALFAGDNGKDIDRFTRIDRGASYHWNGVRESVRLNALYTWSPALAPCGFTFLREDSLGKELAGHGILAGYGPPAALGPNHSKVLLDIQLDEQGKQLAELPRTLLKYTGQHRATVLGVAEGSDGIYFTDFFGETSADDSAEQGNVWRLHLSDATRNQIAAQANAKDSEDSVERGRAYFFNFCTSCHYLDGVGGHEGPELTHFSARATALLNAKAYEAQLAAFLDTPQGFIATQKQRLEEVQRARGRERVRVWLHHHLEEPRFDHPRAKMPSMSYVAPSVRQDIVDFLMSRVPEAADAH